MGLIPGLGRFPWRRKWQPTAVFLPGKSLGQRSLAGYSPLCHKESDTTEHMSHTDDLGSVAQLSSTLEVWKQENSHSRGRDAVSVVGGDQDSGRGGFWEGRSLGWGPSHTVPWRLQGPLLEDTMLWDLPKSASRTLGKVVVGSGIVRLEAQGVCLTHQDCGAQTLFSDGPSVLGTFVSLFWGTGRLMGRVMRDRPDVTIGPDP